jgi:hypothetical protein
MAPLLKGGQGRTSASVKADGAAIFLTILGIFALVVLLCVSHSIR